VNVKSSSRLMFLGMLAIFVASSVVAQEPATPTPSSKPAPAYKTAIKWKRFDYTCEGDAKLTVYLHDQTVKVRFKESDYLMRQVPSADGGRYSDGKVVWWSVGNGGFLQEDTPDGDGKMIAKDCKLDKPMNGGAAPSAAAGSITGTVSGSVSYLQRIALPPTAVIQVQLLDDSPTDAHSKIVIEEKITLGDRQVPVPFELKFDPSTIDPKHSYSVSAAILMDGNPRFLTDVVHPVLTRGYPSHVELILKSSEIPNPSKP
jgi:putative lipoprotein